MKRAVVQFSGGVGSWAAAKRTAAQFGAENTTLLFADTLIEDEDLYRFIDDAVADVGAEFVRIADGRTPWEVFRDVRYIGNTRIDPCSMVLKRNLLRAWIEEHCDPRDTAVVLGIDWSEVHRYQRAIPRWEPYKLLAPLCDESEFGKMKDAYLAELAEAGIEPPRLYAMGFPHNNCGGFCVKAGMAQFELLYRKMPERYAMHEAEEQRFREAIGKDVSILRDRSKGAIRQYMIDNPGYSDHGDEVSVQDVKAVPLTLRRFRERLETKEPALFDQDDWGGCGCAVD